MRPKAREAGETFGCGGTVALIIAQLPLTMTMLSWFSSGNRADAMSDFSSALISSWTPREQEARKVYDKAMK